MAKTVQEVLPVLRRAVRLRRNVAIRGTHGTGKSETVMALAKEFDLEVVTLNGALMDQYVDFVGIPRIDPATKTLELIRPERINNAEWIVIEECNRSQPKTMNAILELIQFHTINGVHLPNLQMVWIVYNPPSKDYHVLPFDKAFIDRFHVFIELKGAPSVDYYLSKGIGKTVAEALCNWWTCLPTEHQTQCSPRRLEYIGQNWQSGFAIEDCMPPDFAIPTASLQMLLSELQTKSNVIRPEHLCEASSKAKILETLTTADLTYHCAVVEALSVLGVLEVINSHMDVFTALQADAQARYFSDNADEVKVFFPTDDPGADANDAIKTFASLAKQHGVYA